MNQIEHKQLAVTRSSRPKRRTRREPVPRMRGFSRDLILACDRVGRSARLRGHR